MTYLHDMNKLLIKNLKRIIATITSRRKNNKYINSPESTFPYSLSFWWTYAILRLHHKVEVVEKSIREILDKISDLSTLKFTSPSSQDNKCMYFYVYIWFCVCIRVRPVSMTAL